MTTTLESIFKVFLFMVVMILVFDIGSSHYVKGNYKGGLNFACKSASQQINRDDDYARGIVTINETEAKEEYERLMMKNFNLSKDEVEENTLYSETINTVPTNFTNPYDGNSYTIEKPIFIAIYSIKRNGVFVNNEIIIDNLSGSQVSIKVD